MKVVFLGLPGAGKGTQAQLVAKTMSAPHISTGDMLRAAMEKQTPMGMLAKQYVTAGELVPDTVIIAVVEDRLGEDDCKGGFLLDGFPRNIEQAEALDENDKLDAVVYFGLDEDTAVERLSNRRTCRGCKATYHTKYMPPKEDGKCDECGAELYQRDDDHPEAIRERMRVYREETAELVDYYRQAGVLREISAAGDVEEIHGAVLEALGLGGKSGS